MFFDRDVIGRDVNVPSLSQIQRILRPRTVFHDSPQNHLSGRSSTSLRRAHGEERQKKKRFQSP